MVKLQKVKHHFWCPLNLSRLTSSWWVAKGLEIGDPVVWHCYIWIPAFEHTTSFCVLSVAMLISTSIPFFVGESCCRYRVRVFAQRWETTFKMGFMSRNSQLNTTDEKRHNHVIAAL